MVKMEMLYAELSDVLDSIQQRSNSTGCQSSNASELPNHIMELRDQIRKERNDYNDYIMQVSYQITLNISCQYDLEYYLVVCL